MFKRLLAGAAAVLATAAVALAGPVTVTVNLPGPTTGLSSSWSAPINGVRFAYDAPGSCDPGNPPVGGCQAWELTPEQAALNTAAIGSQSIFGSTSGGLRMDFSGAPFAVIALRYTFTVTAGNGTPDPATVVGAPTSNDQGANVYFYNTVTTMDESASAPDPTVFPPITLPLGVPATFDHTVASPYPGTFDQATVYFAPFLSGPPSPGYDYVPYQFTLTNLQYDAVPEPGTMALWGLGLLAVGGAKRLRRKS